ncbi:hypothetical protein G7048_19980 [Diaphorobacter sp. HDW4B]|uniref:ankyrin repeat domain-containing protein n=1 Tax=Diaphorobacter sp. HDW4B TaxID=2714925 RepID=UPI00140C8879|nr:ankyrin repeat domain-containing protein [Diaphorobacter sp. HDW4B]QIL72435.1 hypothetical protein G7048_19980 [Diaphorobacter sp. HDW4B]
MQMHQSQPIRSPMLRMLALTGALIAGAMPLGSQAQANPQLPPMTKAEATEYIKDNDIYPIAGNLAGMIMNGRIDDVRATLAVGVDPNEKTVLPHTPIKLATMTCSGKQVPVEDIVTMIRVLAAGGAIVNTPSPDASPMITAAQQCPTPVVKALLALGGDRNARTTQGFTPLSMALIVRNYDAAQALIDSGATISKEAAEKLNQSAQDDKAKALIKKATK